MKVKLKTIIERTDNKAGRLFDICIQILILVSIIAFSIETIPNLSVSTLRILNTIEITTVGLFTLEYVLRIMVSDHKWKYVVSFYGIVDLIAILPTYLALGFDLRALRIVRMFRVFRLLKLARYNQAMNRLMRAFNIAKEELILFFTATLMMLYVAALGIYYFEYSAQPEHFTSIFHSLWWAVATLTTVGYGDIYPITAGGRIFTFLILMIGLGIVAVPAGLLSSAMSKVRTQDSTVKEDQNG